MEDEKKKKPEKDNGVWYLVLTAFIIGLLALARKNGFFG
jgi:hypothetical protein